MNTPLRYQLSEYDCGPTTLLNAIAVLMPRKQIPPDIIKYIYIYALDGMDRRGQLGRAGTSELAMLFLANTFNQLARARRWPICCEALSAKDIHLTAGSPLVRALEQGAVAVARVYLGCPHYVLFTAVDSDAQMLYLFDPYYDSDLQERGDRLKILNDAPHRWNRRVAWSLLERTNRGLYALGPEDRRECFLLSNACIPGVCPPDCPRVDCPHSADNKTDV
ncbi:MAG: peptidase C39 [Bacillota bacterium]|nr:peptidase C39 [Bacillota bacterium]